MGLIVFAFAVTILVAVNYWAGRTSRPATGKLVLLASSLPALALTAFASWKFGHAIVNANEVNRRFQEGDLTNFGADMFFGMSFVFSSIWIVSAYVGFVWGRRNQNRT